jgi:hypothetical protein
LEDADFARPTILSGAPPFPDLQEDAAARAWRRLPSVRRTERPVVVSLRHADVAALTVANVDLEPCLFNGTHNLDRLRIEADAPFGSAPQGWRWTRRRVLAEERAWRARTGRGWEEPTWPQWFERPPALAPEQIDRIYRTLRKGREDSKDEPGAADFYYGEMEMRRHAARHFSPERWLLTLYWLVSGYALRAWRALAALAAALVLFAALCSYGGGFAPTAAPTTTARNTTSTNPAVTTGTTVPRGPTTTTRSTPTTASAPTTTASVPSTTATSSLPTTTTADTSFGGAVVYGARTIVGLARDPQPRLTRWGNILQILLRVLGPVLLGLAILSVRGRVKR